MFGDLDGAVQALHRHIRNIVALPQPDGGQHLVELNHTPLSRNGLVTEGQFYSEIDLAAELRAGKH